MPAVLIIAGAVGIAIVFNGWARSHGVRPEQLRWLLAPTSSIVVFALIAATSRHLWRARWFWLSLSAMCAVGMLLWAIALLVDINWSAKKFFMVVFIETMVAYLILARLETRHSSIR